MCGLWLRNLDKFTQGYPHKLNFNGSQNTLNAVK